MDKEKIQRNDNGFQMPMYNVLLWVNERATNGDKKALTYIDFLYKWEVLKEIVKWMVELAEQGDVNTQYNLGLHYKQTPYGDDKEAVKWFTKAAENGHIQSCWNLGMYYEYGLGDVDKDIAEAIKWYTKVANSNENYAEDAEQRIKKLVRLNSRKE